jgi:hypothetical protein
MPNGTDINEPQIGIQPGQEIPPWLAGPNPTNAFMQGLGLLAALGRRQAAPGAAALPGSAVGTVPGGGGPTARTTSTPTGMVPGYPGAVPGYPVMAPQPAPTVGGPLVNAGLGPLDPTTAYAAGGALDPFSFGEPNIPLTAATSDLMNSYLTPGYGLLDTLANADLDNPMTAEYWQDLTFP